MFVFTIKKVRKDKKISLRNLSKRTGISRPYLFDLENDRKINPSLDTMYKIANALNVKIDDLFFTELDIEKLRRKMHRRINKYGINSKEVLEVSQIIDLLINIKMDKNISIK